MEIEDLIEKNRKKQIDRLIGKSFTDLKYSLSKVSEIADSPYVSHKDISDLIGCVNWAAKMAEEKYASLLDKIELNYFKSTGTIE